MLVAATLLAFPAAPGRAATLGAPWTIEATVADAELVFRGKVVDVAFRDSDPSLGGGDAALPHTFVTYRIEEVIRGKPSARRLTLRFLGGWSETTGRIMVIPHAPLFREDAEDIVFVVGNGEAACPLVGCGLGRFRVSGGHVFDNNGLAVRRDAMSGLRFGPDRLPHEQMTTTYPPAPAARLAELRDQLADTDLSDEERATLRRRLDAMSRPRVFAHRRVVEANPPTPPSTPPLTVERFRAFIEGIARGLPEPDIPVPSVPVGQPFSYPEMVLRPAEPPTRIARPPDQPLTVEQQLLRRNNGNPVLEAQP